MKNKIPDDQTVHAPAKLERYKLSLDELPQALRERAHDSATITAHSGPKTQHAVKMALLHIADVLQGGQSLRVKQRPVLKRIQHEAQPQLEG